jgi:hypothetical protein
MRTGASIPGLEVSREEIADFCRRWKIVEFSVFGSVLRADFRPDSDVDVLVSFAADAEWSLLDHVRLEQELAAILGREVDVVSKRAVVRSENWVRRKEILRTAQVVYATG